MPDLVADHCACHWDDGVDQDVPCRALLEGLAHFFRVFDLVHPDAVNPFGVGDRTEDNGMPSFAFSAQNATCLVIVPVSLSVMSR